jgi:hypothetical protein
MPVAFTNIEKIGRRRWRWTWNPTDPPYRVVWRGLEIANRLTEGAFEYAGGAVFVEGAYASLEADADEPPAIEVLGASEGLAASEANPPYAVLQWRGYAWARFYRVEQKTGATWSKVADLPEDGRGYYPFASRALQDAALHEFRIVAYDARGQQSPPVPAAVFTCSHPEPPKYDPAYNASTRTLTFTPR